MKRARFILWVAVAVAAVWGVLVYSDKFLPGSRDQSTVSVGGSFSMTDHNGQPVTEKSYPEKARAMFFGFTNCPDVCPTTLMRMASLMKQLGPDLDKIQVILVSVDTERDRPETLKPYLSAFDERFVDLTGTAQQLADFAAAYRFYYKRVPTTNGDYTMDHSAGVYLYDGSGAFRGTLDPHESDDVAIKKLRNLLR